MKSIGILLILFLAANAPAENLTTLDGKTYEDVQIVSNRSDATGVTIRHKSGIARIAYHDMSGPDRVHFGYDDQKEKEYLQAQARKSAEVKAEADAAESAALRRKQEDARKAQEARQAAEAKKLAEEKEAELARQAALVTVKDDKFRGTRTFKTASEIKLGYEFRLDVYAVSPDGGRTAPAYVALHFISSSSEWRFLKFHPLILLIDEERVSWDSDDVSHNGDVGHGYVLEQMHVRLKRDQLRKLALAKTVEGKLGIIDFSLPYEKRESLRVLSEILKSQEGSTANKAPEAIGAETAPQPQR